MSVPIGSDTPGEITQDDKTMAMIAYILGFLTGFVGPLILYLVKKDQSKFVAYHSLQALIFHAAISIGYFIATLLSAVLIGVLLFPVVGILSLVFSILAAMAANRGEWYEIPFIGQFTRQQSGL